MNLPEKHRPRSLDDVVGQDAVVSRLRRMKSFGGNCFWLSGGSGQGKSSIGKIIAGCVAGELATHELNAKDVDLEYVREMEYHWKSTVLPSPGCDKVGRAWIFNEAQNLRASICERFLTTLEEIPDHVVIVFTTTQEEQTGLFDGYDNAPAFLSRCLKYKLTAKGLADAFAERARAIAVSEGLDGKPIQAYKRLVMDCRNNMRDVINCIQAGDMIGGEA